MLPFQYNPPDTAAMERALNKHRFDATGIVMNLAWRTGLSRKEICELTWEQVDFDAGLLRLPDREVPIPPEAEEPLWKWRKRCERFSPYVAVSPLRRQRLAKQSLSVMVRAALDEEGQKDVRLQDLRHDFIQRQLQEHDWPYVLRVSGLSVSTYRSGLHEVKPGKPEPEPKPRDDPGEDFKLWRVLQTERNTPEGIALWLSSHAGLQVKEIVALTWEQVDFERKLLHLPNRDVELPVSVCHVLEDEKARRAPGDDPHVILSPRSRNPVTAAWLTTLVRSALIRGGIENRSLRDLRLDPVQEAENQKLIRYVEENGAITRREAMSLLELSQSQAYRRLTALVESGKLEHVNTRYYLAGTVMPFEYRDEAILGYLQENGPAYRQDIAAFLHLGNRTTARILKGMTESGQLMLMQDKRYFFSSDGAVSSGG